MNYWLLKTEPSVYSYDDLVKDKKTVWDGVGHNTALINIRNARKGDLAFIYHTGTERQVVGISEIISDPYKDPKSDNSKMAVFDVKPVSKLANPVTLAQIKADKKFSEFRLVKESRLSVVSVPENIWKEIIKMGK
ncbi:MAG TPA: EVE domain-containing protein [Ignavibacteria bacterium]|nr:EVE domain-containing protein [Ignavibacteria bacterium]HMR40532.1 EVE domain-containing protein [Ignavibacteria bacterium]